jgi:Na+/melibiose symporter-like transporter
VFPLIQGQSHGWPAWTWLMMTGSAVVLAVFVVTQRATERRTGSSLLPMHLFANRGFSAGLVTQAVFQGSLAGFSLATIIYVQAGLGFSAFAAGLMLLPFSLGAFVGTAVSVPLGMKLGKVVMVTGAGLQSVATVWVLATVRARADALATWSLVPALLVAGIGLGLLVVPLADVALATIPTDEAGAASGAYGTVQQVGAALGVAVIGTVFFSVVGTSYDVGSLRSGLVAACWVAAAGYALAAVASLLLPSRAQVHAHQEAVEREQAAGDPVAA